MSFQDTVYQATWNQQIFGVGLQPTANIPFVFFNPLGSGKNVLIVSYTITSPIVTVASRSPVSVTINGTPGVTQGALFAYWRNVGASHTPASAGRVTLNLTTGAVGQLQLNTGSSASFPVMGPTIQYGDGAFDLQSNSSIALYDVVDPNLQPVVLYPGDAFGLYQLETFSSVNSFIINLTTAEL